VDAGVKKKVTDSNNVLLVSMCLAALDNSHDWLAGIFRFQQQQRELTTSKMQQASNAMAKQHKQQ
jgi:hypothetical protein